MRGINLVPYQFMEAEFALAIRGYLAQMSRIGLIRYNKVEQLAYWLNVHNAAVVLNILEAYPIDELVI